MDIQLLGNGPKILRELLFFMAKAMGTPIQYKIQPLIKNPGLIYEKLETVRTIKNIEDSLYSWLPRNYRNIFNSRK